MKMIPKDIAHYIAETFNSENRFIAARVTDSPNPESASIVLDTIEGETFIVVLISQLSRKTS